MNRNENSSMDGMQAGVRATQYNKRKKVVKTILIVCAVVIALYLVTMSLDPDALVDGWFSDHNAGSPQLDIEFYPVDEDLDIFLDEEYLAYDRNVSYYDPDTGATYSVEEKDLATQEEYVRFFYSYFQTVIWGDAVNYAEHFSSSYEGELPEDFTMQMVYDIQIQPHLSSSEGNTYIVDYKIRKNNGTFRRDIGSDQGRQYLFCLAEENGELRITQMGPYTSY